MNKQSSEYLSSLRHSTAHLLAAAVMELWPTAKKTIGPSIENGFYFDFDFSSTGSEQVYKVSEDDFPAIEAKMKEIIGDWKSFERIELSKEEALKEYSDNEYKKELIEEFSAEGQTLTMYKSGRYSDLCRGGHVDHPNSEIKHFKLLSIAGAYWRGDEKNKMLTRIYGTVFPTKVELDNYLLSVEEARKRDHRKIGKELDLFSFSEYVGSGLPLYSPKGALIRRLLTEFIEEEQSALGYTQVWTPQIAKAELFKISGHYDKYHEDMFRVTSNYSKEEFFLKPMNCPQHTQIYAARPRSYKDLPLRYSDFAMLYRDERPGELSGLARVRSFSTDDCHIFCREDQVDEEIDKALQMTKKVMNVFGFKYRYRLSTRDPKNKTKYLGDPQTWDKVEAWAVEIMKRNEIEYYDGPGEAAFYAPKMDLMATDAIGREWQLSTVQIDFVQPERFGLTYTDSNGSDKLPVMIHRAVLGSAERAMMILIEHFAGSFPVWLSPVQVKVLPISEKHLLYAKEIQGKLMEQGIRVELDERNETLNAKIRDAQLTKVPYMIILGDREVETAQISVRKRDNQKYEGTDLAEFTRFVLDKVAAKALEL